MSHKKSQDICIILTVKWSISNWTRAVFRFFSSAIRHQLTIRVSWILVQMQHKYCENFLQFLLEIFLVLISDYEIVAFLSKLSNFVLFPNVRNRFPINRAKAVGSSFSLNRRRSDAFFRLWAEKEQMCRLHSSRIREIPRDFVSSQEKGDRIK